MTTSRAPGILTLVRDDIMRFPLIIGLFVLVVASAMAVIYVAHATRLVVIERDQLSSQRDQLDIEWRHLTIEQNALTETSRVERLALEQLNMVRPDPEQEVLVPWQ